MERPGACLAGGTWIGTFKKREPLGSTVRSIASDPTMVLGMRSNSVEQSWGGQHRLTITSSGLCSSR
jgi:hypothetical protein